MRRWKIAGATSAGVVLALATLPYWMGACLPAARLLHLTVGSYQREGYGRFRIRDGVYQHENVRVTVAEADADTPLLWAWKSLRGSARPVQVRGWKVSIGPAPGNGPGAAGLSQLHGALARLAKRLERWVPEAEMTGGSVRWPTGGFRLERADWNRGELRLAGLSWGGRTLSGRVVAVPAGSFRIEADESDLGDARLVLLWTAAAADGQLWLWGRPVDLHASIPAVGWLPAEAQARVSEGSVALPGLAPGSAYREWRGGGEARWQDGRFRVSVHAAAEPQAKGLPPLRIAVEAAGDRQAWSVQTLDLELPAGHAVLNEPIAFGYRGKPSWNGARLAIALDLAGLPLLHAKGSLSGEVRVVGALGSLPSLELNLAARQAAWREFPVGDYTLTGRCDLGRREVSDLKVTAAWAGSALARWLPDGGRVGSVTALAQAEGPWSALRHGGTARIQGLALPHWEAFDGTLAWSGVQASIPSFRLRASAGSAAVNVQGAATPAELRLSHVEFTPAGEKALRLAAPVTVGWRPRLVVGPFSLAGDGAEISGGYSPSGISLHLARVPSRWIGSLARWSGPDFEVHAADLSAHWDQGRLAFAAQAGATIDSPQGRVDLSLNAQSEGPATLVRELRLSSGGSVLAQASGTLPVCWMQGERRWRADPRGRVTMRAQVDPRSPVWRDLAAPAGLAIERPEAVLTVDGTLDRPVGRLHLAIDELGALPGRAAWKAPPLRRIQLEAHADRGIIVVERLEATVLGHPLSGSARLPLEAASWRSLGRGSLGIDWKNAQASLAVAEAPASALAALFPSVLRPEGTWSVRGELKGGELTGALRLSGLSLRPIAPIGLVQGISGTVNLEGRSLSLRGVSAQVGGATLALSGQAEVPAAGSPRFDLRLRGASIPLVRQANLLVRSDLDLRVEGEGTGASVRGRAVVGDGLLLGDLSSLLPSGMTGGSRPPPYFSVGASPFNSWRLDVAIAADRTLRVQTPLFSGTGSAQLRLLGTLGDPRAVGQLQVNQGQVSLPFASFEVQFGAVRLNADDPFHPRIDLQATARRYDYDIQMRAAGPADAPVLTFSSNPALPSDQLLALVMAGQLPQNGTLGASTSSQVAGLGAYVGQNLLSGFSGQPGANRLTVTSGQELSVSGRPTYEIQYQLAPRWWLVGQYDIFDDYNADLKWRVYSEGPKQ
ncbi:MAG TPA: translocation/assembly module TamB domain-containing protein [Opitutaceae bacterium]|nr:translocation/assembly module TamB domain-containing protein [Opitutaceae bacterium]